MISTLLDIDVPVSGRPKFEIRNDSPRFEQMQINIILALFILSVEGEPSYIRAPSVNTIDMFAQTCTGLDCAPADSGLARATDK